MTEVKKRKRFISPTGIALRQVPDHRSRDARFTSAQCHGPFPAGEEYTSWQAARSYLKANGDSSSAQSGVLLLPVFRLHLQL